MSVKLQKKTGRERESFEMKRDTIQVKNNVETHTKIHIVFLHTRTLQTN